MLLPVKGIQGNGFGLQVVPVPGKQDGLEIIRIAVGQPQLEVSGQSLAVELGNQSAAFGPGAGKGRGRAGQEV